MLKINSAAAGDTLSASRVIPSIRYQLNVATPLLTGRLFARQIRRVPLDAFKIPFHTGIIELVDIELDREDIGKITEAVAEKNFAKGAGVIAGAVVGAAATGGLGLAGVAIGAVTGKLVEGFVHRLSETNTEKMLATYRSISDRQEFIQTITRQVVSELQEPKVTHEEATSDISLNMDAWFTQLFKYLHSQNHGPVPFASASEVKVISPNLD